MRKLTPGGKGEKWIKEIFGTEEGAAMIEQINTQTVPPPHNHRCNEAPIGKCADMLRESFGQEEGQRMVDEINADADRFAAARADRSLAQSIQFGNRAAPVTPERQANYRKKAAERAKRYRERMKGSDLLAVGDPARVASTRD